MYIRPIMAQSQISRTLRSASGRERVSVLLAQESFSSRQSLGRRVCEEFSFVDPRGRPQIATCLKALISLAAQSPCIQLPPPSTPAIDNTPRLLPDGVADPLDVPSHPSRIQDLELVVVRTPDQRSIWNTLIHREHPHGMTTFAGCQMRYLVGSTHGWLGAAGFSASARRIAARDRWMAWNDAQRRDHLNRVVCLSRFLIRPMVRCPHLASHVLGGVLRRLPRDFAFRYGYRPWLVESFADAGYDGTCLLAANFLRVGETAGRGRQDVHNEHQRTVKTVLMYPLDRRWRQRLGVPEVDLRPVLGSGEGLHADQWVANEFGGAPLNDRRLSARLVKSVELLASHPGQKINADSRSDRTAINAFYRLIDMPEESAVTVENILAPHRERSIQRVRGQGKATVLMIQDGTDLRFATRPGCDGLQVVGRNQTSAKTLGLHLHATLAVSAEGLPLGVLRMGFDDRREENRPDNEAAGDPKKKQYKMRRWKDGFMDIAHAVRDVGGKTRIVSVCDREADCFEMFDLQRRHPRVELLVRAKHDRVLGPRRPRLFPMMSAGEPDGLIDIEIEGLTERPKSSRKPARPARLKRSATCELRYCQVTLPATDAVDGAEPVTVSAVHVVEMNPPAGEDPVQWYLLTTLDVRNANAASEVVGYYLQRWKVEDFFRVLKSGCRVEFLLFRTAERLRRAIAINAVIAWRIMVMTLLGRQVPECDPGLMFTESELDFLREYGVEYELAAPDRLGDAVKLVAHLGGYRERKGDSGPGNQIMWHGQTRLSSASLGYRIGYNAKKRHVLRGSK